MRTLFAALAALVLVLPASARTMEDALLDALIAKGVPGDDAVSIIGRAPEGIDPDTLEVASIDYTPATGVFIAQIKLPTGRTFGVQGKVETGVDLPVLARALQPGDVASSDDVVFMRIARSRVIHGSLTQATDIVGYSAKRQLRPNVALRDGDFEKPIIIHKGDAVTMAFRMPGLELTARGKALANAGLGDTVAVLNEQSHKQIDAVVTGSGAVTVSPPPAQAAALN